MSADRIAAHEILRGYRDVGRVLGAEEGDLRTRLTYLLRATTQLLGCDRCAILIFKDGCYRAEFDYGYPDEIAAAFADFSVPADAPLVAAAMESDGFIFVNDAQHDPMTAEVSRLARIESFVLVTMVDVDGQPLGLMSAEFAVNFAEFDELSAEVVAGVALLARNAIVTDRVRSHRREALAERKLMLERLADVEERERQRIGSDLHDDVLQRVTSLAHFLEIVATQEPEGDPKRAVLERLQREAQASAIELRRLVTDLVPHGSDTLSLRSILEGVVRSAGRRSDAQIRLDALHDGDPPVAVRTALERITRQALDNSIAHAAPTVVDVTYDVMADGTSLRVIDDGVGFLQGGHPTGVGLFSMSERALQLGGHCRIQSAPDEGTRVAVWIPHEHAGRPV